MAKGLPRRAPIIRSPPANIMTSANAPSRRGKARATASLGEPPSARYPSTRCLRYQYPSRNYDRRPAPLATPESSRYCAPPRRDVACGWCPTRHTVRCPRMTDADHAGDRLRSRRSSKLTSLPARVGVRSIRSPVATPAESYPRYSPA